MAARAGLLMALLVVASVRADTHSKVPQAPESSPGTVIAQGAGTTTSTGLHSLEPDVVACPGLSPLPTRHPMVARVVAVGDLHGDLTATRKVLRLAGLIDGADRWIGGNSVLVQLGDVLDRGDEEQAVIDLLEGLAIQARRAGGAVHPLLGNHELMNAAGDLRYVTPGGFADFTDVHGLNLSRQALEAFPPTQRSRLAAFQPGGPYAQILARHNTVVIVGDTVFVHGGVLPLLVDYGLTRLNAEVRCWLRGASSPPAIVGQKEGPVWSRDYSMAPERCDLLETTLRTLGVRRMVVGHTVQKQGANAACDGKVWRIDVGLAAFYGGSSQAIEIVGETVRVLGK